MTERTLVAEDAGTEATGTLDEARVEAFAGRLFELYTGGLLTFMVDIGHRTGLFAAAAAGPRPAPSWRPGPTSRSATCGSGWARW